MYVCWSAVNKIPSSLYLGASDMTATGVLRPKDLEMVLLSTESGEKERQRVKERKSDRAKEGVKDRDKRVQEGEQRKRETKRGMSERT